ncbi:hypothetical protein [Lentilactobacillus kefiri]|uniref:hypothetical protein n=1 Tax=Lentilactobacillus kefiri TaxID=33962 RepID=UPI002073373C|nr:hypothetical protein [Lentilactobacillus kefiri]
MVNLALNGMVHDATLNGKVLFDNSANWQKLDDFTPLNAMAIRRFNFAQKS